MNCLAVIDDPDQGAWENRKPKLALPNVMLTYMYRDYANYKRINSVIFSNPEKMASDQIELALREKLMDEEWFYASQWDLKDLHFEKFDAEIDHPFHELQSIELTDESPTHAKTIAQFTKDTPDFRPM